MKQIAIIILLFITSTTLSVAQESTPIIKKWNLIEIEEFGSKYPKTEEQKSDFFEFTAENKYIGLINGQVIEGTWSDKAVKYILTPNKEKSVFKVNWIKLISIDKDQLVLNYQSVDLIQTKLFFRPAE